MFLLISTKPTRRLLYFSIVYLLVFIVDLRASFGLCFWICLYISRPGGLGKGKGWDMAWAWRGKASVVSRAYFGFQELFLEDLGSLWSFSYRRLYPVLIYTTAIQLEGTIVPTHDP